MSDSIAMGRPTPLGVFHATKTKDGQALERDGHPYYDLNSKGFDPRGQRLYEICFGDGTWMLAVESDLDPGAHDRGRSNEKCCR
jgi:hypothetical protein